MFSLIACNQDNVLVDPDNNERLETKGVATGVFDEIWIRYGWDGDSQGTFSANIENVYTGEKRFYQQGLTFRVHNHDSYVIFGGPHKVTNAKIKLLYNNSEFVIENFLDPNYIDGTVVYTTSGQPMLVYRNVNNDNIMKLTIQKPSRWPV